MKALEGKQKRKADGVDQVTTDLLKNGEQIVLENWPPSIRFGLGEQDTKMFEEHQHHFIPKEKRREGLEKLRTDQLIVRSPKLFTKVIANKTKATIEFNQ